MMSCGMRGSSGSGDNSSPKDIPPNEKQSNCNKVPNSDGKEEQLMDCCFSKANEGPWIPGIHDCHNAADKCIKEAGLENPGVPGGRTGDIGD